MGFFDFVRIGLLIFVVGPVLLLGMLVVGLIVAFIIIALLGLPLMFLLAI
jgi:hypothetical protein